jgi:hypothetical protein
MAGVLVLMLVLVLVLVLLLVLPSPPPHPPVNHHGVKIVPRHPTPRHPTPRQLDLPAAAAAVAVVLPRLLQEV